MSPPRRKKWTEAEEETLIDKYAAMVANGTLSRMKKREKKFKPIALHVNSLHHVRDPIAFPWQWTWKDVSTKVQNMRHQYSLVKQKIKKPELDGDCSREEFDWVEGLTHWSNFLRYKEVFGDVALVLNANDSMVTMVDGGNDGNGSGGQGLDIVEFDQLGHSVNEDFSVGIDAGDNGVLGIGFDYDGDENFNSNNHVKEDGDDGLVYQEVEPDGPNLRKRRKVLRGLEKRTWEFLANELGQLREMEIRFEDREVEREMQRQRRENARKERERERDKKMEIREKEREESRRQRILEWEAMEKESEERERRRREEELTHVREWEERMNRRRLEWKKRIDEMLGRYQAEMGQMQARILHEQQSLSSQLLGIISQWTHPTGLSDHTGASNHYLSQMMQNLHHVNGMAHGDTRVDGDNQDDQFIVDG